MKYSFITFNFGPKRVAHLRVTMRSWEQFTHRQDVEYIVVENGFPYFKEELSSSAVNYVSLGHKGDYLRAQCLNKGAQSANGQYFIFHDNDIPLPANFFEQLDTLLEEGWHYIANFRQLHHLSEPVTRSVFEDPLRAQYGYYFLDTTPDRVRVYGEDGMAGASMTVDRDLFHACGGFHEGMRGWGLEDREFDIRARFVTSKKVPSLKATLVHLYHPRTLPKDNPFWTTNCDLLKKTMGNPAEVVTELCHSHGGTGYGDY